MPAPFSEASGAPVLNIIGGGNVGRTLGRLWHEQRIFRIGDVLNRSPESARHAVSFIGAGRVASAYDDLLPADVYLIATKDDQIEICCEQLARTGHLSAGTVVFHCSGALDSGALQPARQCGAAAASFHPVRSFAMPEKVAQDFPGTYCGAEGDPEAFKRIGQAFAAIGAQVIPVDPAFKTIYHSAAVFACNYLVTLLDVAQQAYAKAGISNDVALKMMEPLVRETVDNVFRLGPANALTGPIARGDAATALRQYRAVGAWNRKLGALYKRLGKLTAALVRRRRA